MLLVEQLRAVSEMVRKLPEDHWRLQGRERMLTLEEQDARAQATIAKLPAIAIMAAMRGVHQVAVFRPRMDEIVIPQGDTCCWNNVTPEREYLRGAAVKVFDYCVAQGLEPCVRTNLEDGCRTASSSTGSRAVQVRAEGPPKDIGGPLTYSSSTKHIPLMVS